MTTLAEHNMFFERRLNPAMVYCDMCKYGMMHYLSDEPIEGEIGQIITISKPVICNNCGTYGYKIISNLRKE